MYYVLTKIILSKDFYFSNKNVIIAFILAKNTIIMAGSIKLNSLIYIQYNLIVVKYVLHYICL